MSKELCDPTDIEGVNRVLPSRTTSVTSKRVYVWQLLCVCSIERPNQVVKIAPIAIRSYCAVAVTTAFENERSFNQIWAFVSPFPNQRAERHAREPRQL